MTTYKLVLEYDGSRYSGWQEQKNARAVAGDLRKAAAEIFAGELELQGAGRTDAGVHALGQVAHLRTTDRGRRHPEQIRRDLNALLPADIVVLAVDRVASSFHARRDAAARTYRYQIATRKTAFYKRYVWWVKEALDVEAMQAAAAALEGRHDFAAFRAVDPLKEDGSTMVDVRAAGVEPEEDLVVFRITASHFLWRMVRRVTGVLVKIGLKEVGVEDLRRLLGGAADPRLDVAAWTAPAAGLFLESVRYRGE